MISNEDLINMCRKLAHKYNRPNDFDDIVSEGAIVCLELRAEDPEVHPAKLYREANRAMHDYINLSLQPVSIPKSWTARDVARGGSGESDNQSYSETGIDWLRNIMSSDHVSYDDFISSIPDHAEEYEKADYENYVVSVCEKVLSERELKLFKMRFWQDMTLDEVADVVGSTKQAIDQQIARSIEKVCNNL